jgi:hypothetical protein
MESPGMPGIIVLSQCSIVFQYAGSVEARLLSWHLLPWLSIFDEEALESNQSINPVYKNHLLYNITITKYSGGG